MNTSLFARLALAALAVGAVPLTSGRQAAPPAGPLAVPAQLSLYFEPNVGQASEPAAFIACGERFELLLGHTEALLAMRPASAPLTALRLRLVGANANARAVGEAKLPGRIHFLRGNDSLQWRRDVPTFAKVKCEQVYPGIDLVYYGHGRQLEYDFIVAPGADPAVIQMEFDGAEDLKLDGQGNLHVQLSGGEVQWQTPFIYQERDGRRLEIAGNYLLTPHASRITFHVAAYDRSLPLVIDPVLLYSTFLGGNANDSGAGIAVDAQGNIYVAGTTTSQNFPTASPLQPTNNAPISGLQDLFISKFNSNGTALIWSTYLGGSNNDQATSLALDAANNVLVAGLTTSTDFPTANAAFPTKFGSTAVSDHFVLKLGPNGTNLIYSTFLGITTSGGAAAVAVDNNGNAAVAGSLSGAFPVRAIRVSPEY